MRRRKQEMGTVSLENVVKGTIMQLVKLLNDPLFVAARRAFIGKSRRHSRPIYQLLRTLRKLAAIGTISVAAVLVSACGSGGSGQPEDSATNAALVAQGKQIFRFDTFGDETQWSETKSRIGTATWASRRWADMGRSQSHARVSTSLMARMT